MSMQKSSQAGHQSSALLSTPTAIPDRFLEDGDDTSPSLVSTDPNFNRLLSSGTLSGSNNSSSSLSSTLLLKDKTDWLTLLDTESKGYLSKYNLYEAVYVSGFIPTVSEMEKVVRSIYSSLDMSAVNDLFAKYNVTYHECYQAIMHFRSQGFISRPPDDGFRGHRSRPEFSAIRVGSIVFLLSGYVMKRMRLLYNYTPMEKKQEKMTLNIVGGLSIFCLGIIYVVFALYFTGFTTTIGFGEIAMYWLLYTSGFTCFSQREYYQQSINGAILISQYRYWLFVLRYTQITSKRTHKSNFTTESGRAFLKRFMDICHLSEIAKIYFDDDVFVSASRWEWKSKNDGIVNGMKEEENLTRTRKQRETYAKNATENHFEDRYSLTSTGRTLKLSLLVALILCIGTIPSLISLLSGESTIFQETHTAVDNWCEIALYLTFLVGIVQFVFVVMAEAVEDTGIASLTGINILFSLTRFASADSFRRKVNAQQSAQRLARKQVRKNPLDTVAPMDIIPDEVPQLRLDRSEDLESFEVIYNLFYFYNKYSCEFHLVTFEFVLFMCFSSVFVIFAMAMFGVSIKEWNALLFAFGIGSFLCSARVLLNITNFNHNFCKEVISGLHTERRSQLLTRHRWGAANKLALSAVSDHNEKQAEILDELIDSLIIDIQNNKTPVKLLNSFSLTKQNVGRISILALGGVATTLFRLGIAVDKND